MDEVDLAKIGLGRVAGHPAAMLDGDTQMHVTFHAESGEQVDRFLVGLAERVRPAPADRLDVSHRLRINQEISGLAG
ncbi:hypothetical protein GCM10009555_039950 [Acrocarpospora macrocephala]